MGGNLSDLKNHEWNLVEDLKSSLKKVGSLYPILEDYYGNIIDGQHRLKADKNWPRRRLEHVRTEKERIIVRLLSNMCRRPVPAREKTELLDKLGEILLQEGVKPGELSKRIAEETGMSYTWVMKYLPDKYKDSSQSRRAISATRRVAKVKQLLRLLNPPKEKMLQIKEYKNSKFVLFFVKKSFYEKIEKISEMLNTTPEILVQNLIEANLRKLASLNYEVIENIADQLHIQQVAI